jgi:hypothetical protein
LWVVSRHDDRPTTAGGGIMAADILLVATPTWMARYPPT